MVSNLRKFKLTRLLLKELSHCMINSWFIKVVYQSIYFQVSLPVLGHLYDCLCSSEDLDNKVHGANMGPTWVLLAPDGPHVGPMNLAIWGSLEHTENWWIHHHTKTKQDITMAINKVIADDSHWHLDVIMDILCDLIEHKQVGLFLIKWQDKTWLGLDNVAVIYAPITPVHSLVTILNFSQMVWQRQ